MKFASIYLSNYIGIYNGMGLYDIHIDMTKCRNRITIIRGDNGSGKSTLSKALNLFPDPSDSFIPGLPARKEIVLIDGDIFYKLSFIHGVKQNGEREVTKAYITKTFNNQAIELNENGNVSSYKDILYSEFGLDANFAALSQLSNDDRGLADKRPAERKRFVNSIISSLETYNNIYKILTKKASNYKSMIGALVAKLNILGDEESLISNLESLEARINSIQNLKDLAVTKLAKAQSTISILDPDNSIQNTNKTIIAELELAQKDINKIQSIIDSLITSNSIKNNDLKSEYKVIVESKNSLIIQNQISRNEIESLVRQKENESSDLDAKVQKLATLQNGHSYELVKEKIDEYKSKLESISDSLASIGIDDAMKLSKDEYILALETLKDLNEYITLFKADTEFQIIEQIISYYLSNGNIPDRIDIKSYSIDLDNMNIELQNLKNKKIEITSRMELLNKLSIRPENCSINSCPFIEDALEFKNTNPEKEINKLDSYIKSIQIAIEDKERIIDNADNFNNAINRFSSIVREVNKNGSILSKMPNGEIFKDKALFFSQLLSGNSFEYMKSIYQYIDMANLFDMYRQTLSIYNNYIDELKTYEGKTDMISSLMDDIDKINKSINQLMDRIDPINDEILENEIKIAKLQELEGIYDTIFIQMDKMIPLEQKISECRKTLLENNRKMNDINEALNLEAVAKEEIAKYTYALEPLMKERDKVHHSVQMMQDYLKEKNELQTNYEFIETVKYYSSPTTGIQLVFMELYMGKIIALANDLLRLLFNGQFEIQPFVINDTEFRIPCLGSGYLNDDISSMSSSQIGMISMILSFALLHHSSTKYNIIKLDEIDGPLDYNNRVYFMDVLNNIMDIMCTEQCIMISHNSELQLDNSDVILLRHDESNNDYNRGNIIWRYQ